MENIPQFDEGLRRFHDFLKVAGYHASPRWIWREDVLGRDAPVGQPRSQAKIYIDATAANDESAIRERYQAAIERGWGMAFCVACVCDGQPCCYLAVPLDATDAEQRWMTSLRCSVPAPCPQATAIDSRLKLWWLRQRFRASAISWATNLPTRTDILAP